MRFYTILCLAFFSLYTAAFAQDDGGNVPPAQIRDKQAEEKRLAETKVLMEQARARQRATDERNSALWARWTYAVCIGCGYVPRDLRIVHTHPLRVLAGIPAADDDARERGQRRRI